MRKPAAMVVAGVMSGTSADGVDVALVRVSPGRAVPKIEVLGHSEFAYPKSVRAAVLQAASGEMKTAELSRLNWKLGAVYAECIAKACAAHGVKTVGSADAHTDSLQLVGMHGQTVFHEAPVATWQIGEAAVVHERLRVPVVSDFRPADMAAGGQAAPLVPMLDYVLFRSDTKNRVLLNLGGIANMTVIPAGAGLEDVIAFDSGPANIVMDALMQKHFGKRFDEGGRIAAKATMMGPVVSALMRHPYFRKRAPKSCGREEFGAEFADRVDRLTREAGYGEAETVGAAMYLTVVSVVKAYRRFCKPRLKDAPTEVLAAGGGVRNHILMSFLRSHFNALGAHLSTTESMGVDPQAKEAVAFALLAWLTWHGLAGNVPSATGAKRAVVLGKISW